MRAVNDAREDRASVDARVDAVLAQIRSRGGRVTPISRRIVALAVEHADEHYRRADFVQHITGEETVAPSTVYRTLDRLVAYGILVPSQLGDGAIRFHLAPLVHEHLVCERCGDIVDTSADLLDEVAERVRLQHGFLLRIGATSLQGTCNTCRKASDSGQA